MTNLQALAGIERPIIQAPMAGVQGSALAIAVSNAGGLGSLPCALLGLAAMRDELTRIKAQTTGPFNVNFFCHAPPVADPERDAKWRAMLAPYYAELGVDLDAAPAGTARTPFSAETADLLAEFKPAVVSFHFGLPPAGLLARVRSWGAKVLSSATTVDEARWLEARGVDAIIAQGNEAGGHRGIFLTDDIAGDLAAQRAIRAGCERVKVSSWRPAASRTPSRGGGAWPPPCRGHGVISCPEATTTAHTGPHWRGRPAHGGHQCLHRPAARWHRQPRREGAWPDESSGASVSAGERGDRPVAGEGREFGTRGLLAAVVRSECQRMPGDPRRRSHAGADRRHRPRLTIRARR